jgi:hypothetical protein
LFMLVNVPTTLSIVLELSMVYMWGSEILQPLLLPT